MNQCATADPSPARETPEGKRSLIRDEFGWAARARARVYARGMTAEEFVEASRETLIALLLEQHTVVVEQQATICARFGVGRL